MESKSSVSKKALALLAFMCAGSMAATIETTETSSAINDIQQNNLVSEAVTTETQKRGKFGKAKKDTHTPKALKTKVANLQRSEITASKAQKQKIESTNWGQVRRQIGGTVNANGGKYGNGAKGKKAVKSGKGKKKDSVVGSEISP